LTALAVLIPSPAGAEPQRYLDEVFDGAEVLVTHDVPYATNLDNGQPLVLDLYEPWSDTATDRPVVIVVHGGGFTAGNKQSSLIVRMARDLAQRGYVTASIQYRLSQSEGITAIRRAVEDLGAAVRWFRANQATGGQAPDHPVGRDLGIDPDRISAGGYSAGAVTALTAALDDEPTPGSNQGWSSDISAAVSMAGAGLSDGIAGDPPIVMFHGTEDTRVDYEGPIFTGAQTCRVARFFGGDCIFHSYPGVAHGLFDNGPREAEMHAATARFLSCRVGATTPFSDLARWYELAAGWASRHGIATGYRGGTFRGDLPVERGQLVLMLWRFADEPDPTGLPGHGFSDVPPWLEGALRWARSEGLVAGYPDGSFREGLPVTRAQATRMLHRFAGSADVSGLPPHGLTGVPAWVDDAVRWLVAPREVQLLEGGGIGSGYPDGSFRSGWPLSRAQLVSWLHGLALAGTAWSAPWQAMPLPDACYRLGDPPA
jgi:acetyl esterase/lipase